MQTDRRSLLKLLATSAAALPLLKTEELFALQAAAPPPKLTLTPLTPNYQILAGAGGNIGILTSPDGTLIIDTGLANTAPAVLAQIKSASKVPVRQVFNTHWHGDHVGANLDFAKEGATIIAHENCRKRLASKQHMDFMNRDVDPLPAPALPTVLYRSEGTLFFGADPIDIHYVANAHTDNDMFLHFANANIIQTGDLFFNGTYPFIDYSTRGWIGGMVEGSEAILKMADAQTKIVPGHGPIGTPEDLRRSHDMLATIQQRIESARKQGKSLDETIAAKPTAEFDERFGKGFMNPDSFTKCVYKGLEAHEKAS